MRYLLFFGALLLPLTFFAQNIKPVVQTGHLARVHSVALANNEQILASGSKDRSIILWKTSDGSILKKLLGHSSTVTALAFSTDFSLLVSAGGDGKVVLWNPTTGNILDQFKGYEKVITNIALNPSNTLIAIGGYDDAVWVYNIESKEVIKKIKADSERGLGTGLDVKFSPDGQHLLIGEDNKKSKQYSTSTWEMENDHQYKNGYCGGCGSFLGYSKKGDKIIKAEHNGNITLFDNQFTILKTFQGKVEDVQSAGFVGRDLFVVTEDSVLLYQGKNYIRESIPKPFKKAKLTHAVASESTGYLYVGMENNTIGRLNLNTYSWEDAFSGYEIKVQDGIEYDPNNYWESHIVRYMSYLTPILPHPDQQSVIRGKFGKHGNIWNLATGETKSVLKGKDKAIISMRFSAGKTQVISGTAGGWVLVHDLNTNQLLQEVQVGKEPIFNLAVSNKGDKIAAASWDGRVHIIDTHQGKVTQSLYMENSSAYSVEFTKNDLYLMLGRLGKSFEQWDIDTGTKVRDFIGHTDVVSQVMWEGENFFYSAGWDGSIRKWNYGNGLQLQKWKAHEGQVHRMVDLNNGQIASAGEDRKVQILNAKTGKFRVLGYHDAPVNDLAYYEKENLLVSFSRDGILKCWDLQTGNMFFEHLLIGTSDWMAISKEGYFSGTSRARNAIKFVQDTTVFSPDQFFDVYYRPSMLQELFKTRGASGKNRSLESSILKEPIPDVNLVVLEDNGAAEVFVRGLNKGGSIDRLLVFHNGKQVGIFKPDNKVERAEWNMDLQLVPGENIIRAVAMNGVGLESAPKEESFTKELSAESQPICYLLSIGINEYKNPQLKLNYAVDDALGFVQQIRGTGKGLFKNVIATELYNEQANAAKIKETLKKLSEKVRPEDVLIIYYAGHGSAVDGGFYFIPHDATKLYDKKNLDKQAIKAEEFQQYLHEIKALKQLIIMDACQSGQSVEVLAQRGASEERAIAQLSRSTGIHVMASAGSDQFSTEFAQLGHGIFTYVLLKGLSGDADGAPKDGKVTVFELKSYLDDQVPHWAEKYKGVPQFPHTFSVGQDFPLLLLK